LKKEEGGGNSTPQAPVGVAVRSYKGCPYLPYQWHHNTMYVCYQNSHSWECIIGFFCMCLQIHVYI